jgi:hypothetical protein
MSLGTPLAVIVAIFFVVPGFIIKKVADAFSPYDQSRKQATLIDLLALSCFNYLAAIVLVYLLARAWPFGANPGFADLVSHGFYLLGWLVVVFVFPVLVGIVLGLAVRGSWLRVVLGRIGIVLLHPAPTAWDYAFARRERYWARVELLDGSLVEGLFGANSLASGDPDCRDIFLESVYALDEETGTYQVLERNRGVWVNPGQIRQITFFDVEPDTVDSDSGTAYTI